MGTCTPRTHEGRAAAKRSLVALAGLALLAGCGSSSKSGAGTTTTTAASGSSDSTAASGETTTTGQPDTNTTAKAVDATKAFSAPCGLVTVADVQAVLPAAPAGEVMLNTSTAAMCSYAVDSDHRVTISLATGPAIEATKTAVGSLPDQTKVDGLGDVGYESTKPTRLDAHFFRGNVEVLMSAYGTTGGLDPLVALAKKVDAAL